MKEFCTLLVLFVVLSTSGQITDRTEIDCEGESRSIYEVGDEGLPLIVASKGFDCLICFNQADNLRDFANENEGNVEVWAAMTFTYSNSTPTCSELDDWNGTHSWGENIFSFIDEEEYWLEFGTPRYYVIHPGTKEIVYEGSSLSSASSTALSLGTTNLNNNVYDRQFSVYQGEEGIVVKKPTALKGVLKVFNIVGQEVFSATIGEETDQVSLSFDANDGIYISSFYSNGLQLSSKFVFKN